jgi:ribosomal protein S6--L-glutamate ligase
LIREIEAQGGEPVVLDPACFSAVAGNCGLQLLCGDEDLLDLDALLIARGLSSRGDCETQLEVYRQLADMGQPQINSLEALLTAQDKVRTSLLFARYGVTTPTTAVLQSPQEARAALAGLGEAVIKPRFGSLGRGMRRVRDDEHGQEEVAKQFKRRGGIYLQRYVPTGGSDFRVFVVGNQACGAIRRRARKGEWRTNMSRGGSVEPIEVPELLGGLAVAAARCTGLDYTAVDIVVGEDGPQVLEVNGHPNFEGFFKAGGADLAVPIVSLVCGRAIACAGWVSSAEPRTEASVAIASMARNRSRVAHGATTLSGTDTTPSA